MRHKHLNDVLRSKRNSKHKSDVKPSRAKQKDKRNKDEYN